MFILKLSPIPDVLMTKYITSNHQFSIHPWNFGWFLIANYHLLLSLLFLKEKKLHFKIPLLFVYLKLLETNQKWKSLRKTTLSSGIHFVWCSRKSSIVQRETEAIRGLLWKCKIKSLQPWTWKFYSCEELELYRWDRDWEKRNYISNAMVLYIYGKVESPNSS